MDGQPAGPQLVRLKCSLKCSGWQASEPFVVVVVAVVQQSQIVSHFRLGSM